MALVLIPAVRRAGLRFRSRPALPPPRRAPSRSSCPAGRSATCIANQVDDRRRPQPRRSRVAATPAPTSRRSPSSSSPHGLLAVSIATTFVPEMARSVARRDRPAFCDQSSLGVRLIALLTVPAGVLLFVLRRAIVGALLQHGEYTAANADNAARALGGFALGLVGFSLYLFVLRGFYAHQDTRTPFVINVVQNVLNIVLAIAARRPLRHRSASAPRSRSPTSCARCGRCRCSPTRCPGSRCVACWRSLWRMVLAGDHRRRGRRGSSPGRSATTRARPPSPAARRRDRRRRRATSAVLAALARAGAVGGRSRASPCRQSGAATAAATPSSSPPG